MALEIIPTQTRGTGAGLKTLASSVGITVGLIISSLITFSAGLAVSFLSFSLLFILVFILILTSLKESKGVNLSDIE
jgi:hypothetical protein